MIGDFKTSVLLDVPNMGKMNELLVTLDGEQPTQIDKLTNNFLDLASQQQREELLRTFSVRKTLVNNKGVWKGAAKDNDPAAKIVLRTETGKGSSFYHFGYFSLYEDAKDFWKANHQIFEESHGGPWYDESYYSMIPVATRPDRLIHYAGYRRGTLVCGLMEYKNGKIQEYKFQQEDGIYPKGSTSRKEFEISYPLFSENFPNRTAFEYYLPGVISVLPHLIYIEETNEVIQLPEYNPVLPLVAFRDVSNQWVVVGRLGEGGVNRKCIVYNRDERTHFIIDGLSFGENFTMQNKFFTSPDNKIIAWYSRSEGKVIILNRLTGEVEKVSPTETTQIDQIAFSQEGDFVIWVEKGNSAQSKVVLYNRTTKTKQARIIPYIGVYVGITSSFIFTFQIAGGGRPWKMFRSIIDHQSGFIGTPSEVTNLNGKVGTSDDQIYHLTDTDHQLLCVWDGSSGHLFFLEETAEGQTETLTPIMIDGVQAKTKLLTSRVANLIKPFKERDYFILYQRNGTLISIELFPNKPPVAKYLGYPLTTSNGFQPQDSAPDWASLLIEDTSEAGRWITIGKNFIWVCRAKRGNTTDEHTYKESSFICIHDTEKGETRAHKITGSNIKLIKLSDNTFMATAFRFPQNDYSSTRLFFFRVTENGALDEFIKTKNEEDVETLLSGFCQSQGNSASNWYPSGCRTMFALNIR